MKIDHDLRQVIKAAHKYQAPLTHSAKQAAIQRAIAKFLNDRPEIKREVTALLKRKVKLREELKPVVDRLDPLLRSLGLNDVYETTEITLRSSYDTFIRAGGDLSEITNHEWQVDEVIAELAAADPKDARKILSNYGIRWE